MIFAKTIENEAPSFPWSHPSALEGSPDLRMKPTKRKITLKSREK